MNKNQFKGRVEEMKGKVKEVAGKLADNDDLELEGNIEKHDGRIKAKVADLKEQIKSIG